MSRPTHPYPSNYVSSRYPARRRPQLSDDVLTRILMYLPDSDLRRLSRVSHAWSKMVYIAGLELHQTVTDIRPLGLRTLCQIVDHVEIGKRPLRLALNLRYRPPEVHPARLNTLLATLLGVVPRTLPFLSTLSIDSTYYVIERLFSALFSHAPHLRGLLLKVAPNYHGGLPNGALRLPPNMFSGSPPCLHTVTIEAPLLDHATAAPHIFSAVRAVYFLLGCEQRDITVAQLFPNVKEVEIDVRSVGGLRLPVLFVSLAGLELRRLAINNSLGRPMSLSLHGTTWTHGAEITYTSPSLNIPDTLWPADPARDFIAYVDRTYGAFCDGALNITTCILDGAWRAVLRSSLEPEQRTALGELAALPCARLTYLVVTEFLLGQLLQTGVTLPALRMLHIDCTPGKHARPALDIAVRGEAIVFCALRCPALTAVQLYARPPALVIVDRANVATLGWLLSQMPGLATARPRLVLSWVNLYSDGSLEDFAAVETANFPCLYPRTRVQKEARLHSLGLI